VNPTNSFKDRPASVVVSKALEFEAKAVGCASTGNLAAAVAAHVAKARLPCYIFIPSGLEFNKIIQVATLVQRSLLLMVPTMTQIDLQQRPQNNMI